MFISENGIELIKRFESFRANAYQDVKGVWTVGYGSTIINGRAVNSRDTINEDEAIALMLNHIQNDIDHIESFISVKLNQNQVDAILAFVYNIGYPAFLRSTFLRLLNQGKFEAAADQLIRYENDVPKGWINSGGKVWKGLINRRLAEKDLFLA